MPKIFTISGSQFAGYIDDPSRAFGKKKKGEVFLSSPSSNVRITRSGHAYTRAGYEDASIDLSEATKPARPFYVKRWNVTFFCLNGKVKFVDHSNSDNVVDTGISLSDTNGLNTRFGEYMGDIYLTNTTDGLQQIHMARVNETAAEAGDGSVVVEQNFVARLSAFSDTTGTIWFAKTTPFSEAYNAVSTLASTVTLTGTLDEDVPDNTIVFTVEDISASIPKASGITFWKERMILWGVILDAGADSSENTVYMSKFAALTTLEDIISFDVAGTAAKEMVGKGGAVTNIIATRDYIYFFTETETYFASEDDVNATTGATPAQLLSSQYGCPNNDCAADLGSGLIVFLTNNNRMMGIRIATDSGATIVYPDEALDQDIRNTVKKFDSDQSASHLFYHSGERILYAQVQIDSVKMTLVYDNSIGKWLPPDKNKVFAAYYEVDGILYATDFIEDTIYQINVGNQDNGQDIDCVMATGTYRYDGLTTSRWIEMEMSGSITQDTDITWTGSVDQSTSVEKSILSSDLSFVGLKAFTDIPVGDMVIGGGGVVEQTADWDKRFRIAPTSYGKAFQPVLQSNGAFVWKNFLIKLSPLQSSTKTLQ